MLIRRPRGRRTHWGSAGERDGKRFAAADGRRGTSVRTTKPWLSQPKGAESRRSGPHRGASRGSSSLASGGERRKESSRSQGPNVRTTTAVKNRGPQARGKAPRSAARARRAHRMTRMSGAAASGGRWVQAAEMPERERGHATRCTKWTPREGRFQRRRPFRVCALHLGASKAAWFATRKRGFEDSRGGLALPLTPTSLSFPRRAGSMRFGVLTFASASTP